MVRGVSQVLFGGRGHCRGGSYSGGRGPLLLGKQLVLVTALNSATDTVDSLVGVLGGDSLEGLLGGIVLLLEKVIVSASIE